MLRIYSTKCVSTASVTPTVYVQHLLQLLCIHNTYCVSIAPVTSVVYLQVSRNFFSSKREILAFLYIFVKIHIHIKSQGLTYSTINELSVKLLIAWFTFNNSHFSILQTFRKNGLAFFDFFS
jgi:hypothetical protein